MVDQPVQPNAIVGVALSWVPSRSDNPEQRSWTVEIGEEPVLLDDTEARIVLRVDVMSGSAIELLWHGENTEELITVLEPYGPTYHIEEAGPISARAISK